MSNLTKIANSKFEVVLDKNSSLLYLLLKLKVIPYYAYEELVNYMVKRYVAKIKEESKLGKPDK